jgi:hypothetical protein
MLPGNRRRPWRGNCEDTGGRDAKRDPSRRRWVRSRLPRSASLSNTAAADLPAPASSGVSPGSCERRFCANFACGRRHQGDFSETPLGVLGLLPPAPSEPARALDRLRSGSYKQRNEPHDRRRSRCAARPASDNDDAHHVRTASSTSAGSCRVRPAAARRPQRRGTRRAQGAAFPGPLQRLARPHARDHCPAWSCGKRARGRS